MMILSGVWKEYFFKTPVLKNIHLNVYPGDFLYVLGGSGAGKTTLLKMMATAETPSEGQLTLFGYDTQWASASEKKKIRQKIGYIPQFPHYLEDLTLLETLQLAQETRLSSHSRFYFKNDGEKKNFSLSDRFSEILNYLGLDHLLHHTLNALSGGEIQRLAIAHAVLRSPSLLIADEPTGAQDKDFTWRIMDLFSKINAHGTAIVLATHDREIVKKIRKRCVFLQKGELIQEGEKCLYSKWL